MGPNVVRDRKVNRDRKMEKEENMFMSILKGSIKCFSIR